jgi:hypothetical protein
MVVDPVEGYYCPADLDKNNANKMPRRRLET